MTLDQASPGVQEQQQSTATNGQLPIMEIHDNGRRRSDDVLRNLNLLQRGFNEEAATLDRLERAWAYRGDQVHAFDQDNFVPQTIRETLDSLTNPLPRMRRNELTSFIMRDDNGTRPRYVGPRRPGYPIRPRYTIGTRRNGRVKKSPCLENWK